MKPAKIANPPSLGVDISCIVLSLGSSSILFLCATKIMEGIPNTEIKKDQIITKMFVISRFEFILKTACISKMDFGLVEINLLVTGLA